MRYQSLELSVDDEQGSDMNAKANLNTIGGGLLIGEQWLFGERFILDTFLGPSYNAGNVKASAGSNEDAFSEAGTFSGFGIRTGVSIGLKF